MDIFDSYINELCNAFSSPENKYIVMSFIMESYNPETQMYEFANGVSMSKRFMDELIKNPEYYKSIIMTNNNIPRPEETTYYQNQPYTQLWNLVAESLQKNIFEIRIPVNITIYEHLDQLNADLKPYGWKGVQRVVGSDRDNSYSVLALVPSNPTNFNQIAELWKKHI
jgi:hypothetical protein